jgi:hypothetical protein
VVVGAVLPRLSGLKLPGVEATLQEVPLDFGAGPSGRSSGTPQLTDTAPRAASSAR